MQRFSSLPTMLRTPSLADRVLGFCGMAIIGLVLRSARLWSKLTRAPWRDD
ncbi:hypothetical protein P7D22_13500 [Lichenihabitans sp. Uapishka_5]|uniref:hypothetical protein n=1 Tax=Lichenihabitans sp. Uapishka_5 TaxID=3037302 RepID=UPI0029E812C2|nr:hypothetical protein [Lichenihabitans sp. Uapishka_5]MDX7952191.1 hypothetical protein [Lichenihabitans sp. Uapishka_5]